MKASSPAKRHVGVSVSAAVRILREVMTGVALNKLGVTDPNYIADEWSDHGVPLEKR